MIYLAWSVVLLCAALWLYLSVTSFIGAWLKLRRLEDESTYGAPEGAQTDFVEVRK